MVPIDSSPWPSLGGQVCDFIENELCFGPGDLRGQPAVLDAEKRALVWRLYEIFPQGHPLAGRRRFKRCALSLAKGLAKSEFSAWIAACELHPSAPVRCVGWTKRGEPIGAGVADAFIVFVAYTEEQSDELAYGALKCILEESAIGKDFDIGLERIIHNSGAGKAVSLSGSPNARDGARTTFCVVDESHRWTLPRLKQAHQVMLANLPKRKLADSWALEITTAPEPGAGSVAENTMEYGKAIAAGLITDAALFFFHRQASDDHDLTTKEGARAAAIEASGPASAWRDIEAIVTMWADPTTDRNYWERVYANRLVQGGSQAFDVEQWDTLKTPINPVKPGDLITLGFDGALFFDSTALVATHVETGYQWKPGVWERPTSLPPDQEWQVPAEEVDAKMRWLFETYTVWRLYADPPYWQSWIAKWRGEWGEERVIEWWTTRTRQMTAALENFTTAITEGTLSHDGDPDLRRHLGNARKRELPGRDEEGKALFLIQKERPKSPNKIDLAMAATLSWECRTDAIAAGADKVSTESAYEHKSLLVL